MKNSLLVFIIVLNCFTLQGQVWSEINSPTNLRIKSCSFINEDIGWIITSDSIFKTTNGGISWISQNYPPDPPNNTRFFNSVHFIDANVGIIACGNYLFSTDYSLLSTTLWTDDGGINWVYKDIGRVHTVDLDARLVSPTIAYATGQYATAKKTIDGGANWIDVEFPEIGSYSSVKLFPINQDTIYFAGLDNFDIKGAFGKTLDGADNWSAAVVSTNKSMGAIYFNDYLNGWIGGYGGEIKYTSDAGQNWITCNSNDTNKINDLSFTNLQSGWAATDGGDILYSSDGGLNWNVDFIGTKELNDISFTKPNNIGYVVGDNGIILKSIKYAGLKDLTKSSVIKIFPNPASDFTIISSEKPLNGVRVSLENSFGQKVKEIKEISGFSDKILLENIDNGIYFMYLVEGSSKILLDKLVILNR